VVDEREQRGTGESRILCLLGAGCVHESTGQVPGVPLNEQTARPDVVRASDRRSRVFRP
jgi:hypothetical protein